MRSLVQHGSKAEKLSAGWFVNQHFLLIFVHYGDANRAGQKDVSLTAGIAGFVNALAGGEMLQLNLAGKHRRFIFIQQGK
jgi:hypothetical protein